MFKLPTISFSLVVLLFCTTACKETTKIDSQTIPSAVVNDLVEKDVNDSQKQEENSKYSNKGSLRFLDNFIYSYKNGEDEGKVVLYYDHINKLVLYHPEDEMTDYVIIDSNGEVYFFYTGEHGDKIIERDQLTFTPDNTERKYPISRNLATVEPLSQSLTINQEVLARSNIILEGYRLNYIQYNDSLDFYVTEQIDVNSEQLHAFEQLINLDWNYPLPLGNLTGIVSQKQLVGKVTTKNLDIVLLYYSPTDFYARISDYSYIEEDENGDLIDVDIPLMEFTVKE